MAREPKCRRVESIPKVNLFKPVGIPKSSWNEIVVKVEELEAIRLKDLLGLEQEECAERMGVSRPTFQRILIEGREKVAEALTEGKAIHISGGDYCLGQGHCRRTERFKMRNEACPYNEDLIRNDAEGDLGMEKAGSKIAICSQGNSMTSLLDEHFGRCAYFVICDYEQAKYETIRNNGPELNHGAGTGAAQELLDRGVGVLICNRIGHNALSVFQKAGVKVFYAEEGLDLEFVLKQYQEGELVLIEN